jgi:methylenetetrahydrofolate reductase (NADPH)
MKITDKFKSDKTILSFEVFPPKKTSPIDTVYKTINHLTVLDPAYISVTYGAGGSGANSNSVKTASIIKNGHNVETLAHLTCVNSSKEDIDEVLKELKDANIENILVLRGDKNPDFPPKEDFKYASDLASYIKSNYDFTLAGACYPEGHIETEDFNKDLQNLKHKVDCGVEFLISQLFFDNDLFYNFYEKARNIGIDVPIEAGIMPITSTRQIQRMVSMCGASLPSKFSKMMQRFENNPDALIDAGIAYAVDQIVDLISNGVDGIHLYTMNNPYVAKKIAESIQNLIK